VRSRDRTPRTGSWAKATGPGKTGSVKSRGARTPQLRNGVGHRIARGFGVPVAVVALMATVLLGIFAPTASRAAPCIDWVGLSPTNIHDWNDGANWLGGVVPGAGDDACISPAAPGVTFTIDHPADLSLLSLTISGPGTVNLRSPVGPVDTFAGGFAITDIAVAPGANLRLSPPTAGATGGVRLAGTFFHVDGHLTIDAAYDLYLAASVTLGLGQALPHTDSSITNDGTVTVEGEVIAESGTLTQNGPSFDIRGALRSLGTRILAPVLGGFIRPVSVGTFGGPPTELTPGATTEAVLRVIGATKLVSTLPGPIHLIHTFLIVQGPLSLERTDPLIIDPGGQIDLANGGSMAPGPTSLPMDIVNDGTFVSNYNPFTGYRIGSFTNNGQTILTASSGLRVKSFTQSAAGTLDARSNPSNPDPLLQPLGVILGDPAAVPLGTFSIQGILQVETEDATPPPKGATLELFRDLDFDLNQLSSPTLTKHYQTGTGVPLVFVEAGSTLAGSHVSSLGLLAPDDTTTAFVGSDQNTVLNDPVTVTVRVIPVHRADQVSGTVKLFRLSAGGPVLVGIRPLSGAPGEAQFVFPSPAIPATPFGALPSLPLGAIVFSAEFVTQYAADPFNVDLFIASSTTATQTVTVGGTGTTTTLTAPISVLSGAAVALSASVVQAVGSIVPTGTVDFFNTTTGLSVGSGTLNASGLAALSYTPPVGSPPLTLRADYSPTGVFVGSQSMVSTVEVVDVLTISVASPPASVVYPNAPTVGVTIASTYSVPKGTVGIFDGLTQIGSAVVDPAVLSSTTLSIVTSTLAVGSHPSVTASFTPDAPSLVSPVTSAAGTVAVVKASSVTTLTISPAAPSEGGTLTLSVSVGGAGATPTGSVQITQVGSPAVTVSLVAGAGSVTVPAVAGSQSYTANYGGDGNYTPSSGSASIAVTTTTTTTTTTTSVSTTTTTTTPSGGALITSTTLPISTSTTTSLPTNSVGLALVYLPIPGSAVSTTTTTSSTTTTPNSTTVPRASSTQPSQTPTPNPSKIGAIESPVGSSTTVPGNPLSTPIPLPLLVPKAPTLAQATRKIDAARGTQPIVVLRPTKVASAVMGSASTTSTPAPVLTPPALPTETSVPTATPSPVDTSALNSGVPLSGSGSSEKATSPSPNQSDSANSPSTSDPAREEAAISTDVELPVANQQTPLADETVRSTTRTKGQDGGAAMGAPRPVSPPDANVKIDSIFPVPGPYFVTDMGAVLGKGQVDRPLMVRSIAAPTEISFDAALLARNSLLALLLMLLVALPSELFNATFRTHHDEVIRHAGIVQRKLKPIEAFLNRLPNGVGLVFFAGLAGALWAFVDPTFGWNKTSLALIVGLTAAIAAVTFISALTKNTYLKRSYGIAGRLRILPSGVLLAVSLLLISRAARFNPGYLFGVFASLSFTKEPTEKQSGKAITQAAVWMLVVAVASWILWVPIKHLAVAGTGGLGVLLLDAFLSNLWVWSLQALVFSLIPLDLLDGKDVMAWSRKAWIALYGVVMFIFVHTVLHPNTLRYGSNPNANIVTMSYLFIGFMTVAVLFWAYFQINERLHRRGSNAIT
jgi:hypothetical protein